MNYTQAQPIIKNRARAWSSIIEYNEALSIANETYCYAEQKWQRCSNRSKFETYLYTAINNNIRHEIKKQTQEINVDMIAPIPWQQPLSFIFLDACNTLSIDAKNLTFTILYTPEKIEESKKHKLTQQKIREYCMHILEWSWNYTNYIFQEIKTFINSWTEEYA